MSMVGLEPTTTALRAQRSKPTELHGLCAMTGDRTRIACVTGKHYTITTRSYPDSNRG